MHIYPLFSGNYDSCLENLEQLESLNASNSKLLHNRAVAHFYKTNCTNYKQLLKSLEELDSTEVSQFNIYWLYTKILPRTSNLF